MNSPVIQAVSVPAGRSACGVLDLADTPSMNALTMPTFPEQSEEWEVWQARPGARVDVRVLRGTTRLDAVAYLDECRAHEADRGSCDYYLVRASVTRTREDEQA